MSMTILIIDVIFILTVLIIAICIKIKRDKEVKRIKNVMETITSCSDELAEIMVTIFEKED